MLEVKRRLDRRAALALGAWIGYVLMFIPLYQAVGEMMLALAVLPVISTAALYGMRAGMLTGLLSYPLNLLLVTLIAGTPGPAVTWRALFGSALILVLGLVTGRIRDLGKRAKGELAERRQAESQRDATLEALRESEERYRTLFETMPVGLYRSTPAGQILDANPALCRMLGYPDRESLLAVDAADTYANVEDRRRLQAVLEQDGMVRDFECQFRGPDGTIIWVEDNARPIRDQDGSVLYYEGSMKDVTDRVEAQQALQESEERYRTLFETMPVGLYRSAPAGQILDANPALWRMLGHPDRESLLAVNAADIYSNVEDRRRWQAMLEQDGLVRDFECRFRQPDGTVIWVENNARAVRDQDSSVLYYEGSMKEVTDRVEAQQALRASREYLQTLLSTIPTGVVVIDAQTHVIVSANPAALEMIGAPQKQIVGSVCHGFFCPTERGQCPITDLGQTVDESERVLLRANGDRVPILKTVVPVMLDGREYLLESFTNIAERKRAAETLQRERDRAQQYLDIAGVILVALNENGEITLMNRRGHRILGYEEGELVGRDWFDTCLPAHTREETRQVFQQLMAGEVEPVETNENHILTASGEERIIAWHNSTPTDETGRISGVLSSGEDITERRWAETERDATLAALSELNVNLESQVAARTADIRAEKEKSETILSSAGDAIALTDLELQVQYVNQAFATLTGHTAEEMIGQSMDLLMTEGLPERDRQSMEQALARGEVWQGDITARRKDGRPYDAAMTIAPVYDADDRLVGHVCSHQDISGRVELDRARARFMTHVSHELRTPLTNLQLYAQLLREGRRPEKAERYHQVLEEQAKRLGGLIQDMLEMATLDGGKAMEVWKPVSLPTCVRDAVNRYQDQATAAGLSLVARPVPAGLRPVPGDQARLGQALAEVVENAVTFTPAGGHVMLEVSAAEDEGQDWVTISVHDTGPGISAEEQERVFDRFFRGKLAESGHVPGTGLGLSMAQEILRAHGGRITVESQLGEGTTFTLWLRS